MISEKFFANTINEVAIKSNNLMIQLQREKFPLSLIHLKNNLENKLCMIEQMVSMENEEIPMNMNQLCAASNKLRIVLHDIMERKVNTYTGTINNICSLVDKIVG